MYQRFSMVVFLGLLAVPQVGIIGQLLGGNTAPLSPPPGSFFSPPAENQCQSTLDRALGSLPGVIAFWPLCESVNVQIGHDYVGQWDSAIYNNQGGLSFGNFTSVPSPLPDGERAAQSPDSSGKLGEQGIIINKRAGTLATWVNNDAPAGEISVLGVSAAPGGSAAAILTQRSGANVCYEAFLVTPSGGAFKAEDCSTAPNTWHPVVMTWDTNSIKLYLDGSLKRAATYSGSLQDAVYLSTMFPSYAERGANRQMSLVKAIISNQTWSADTVAAYTRPTIVTPPAGGAYITAQQLGTVHEKLLGYADLATDLSTPALASAYARGVQKLGARVARYAGSGGGITADQVDWHPGSPVQCGTTLVDGTSTPISETHPAQSVLLNNNIDTFASTVAVPNKNMAMIVTANYGTNPPSCNAGGDPKVNAGDLAAYIVSHHYNAHMYEVGNEQMGCGSKKDLHSDPTCANGHIGDYGPFTYVANEPAFYDAIHANDPGAQVAVTMNATGDYDYIVNGGLPCMMRCKFDAIVDHLYPMSEPITDGTSVYPERLASGLARIPGSIKAYQTLMLSFGKDPSAIWMTEWNGAPAGNAWSNQSLGLATPLYMAQQLGEYANLGLQAATFWAEQGDNYCNSYNQNTNNATGNYGTYVAAYNWHDSANCGTFALIYTGSAGSQPGSVDIGMKPGDLTPAGHLFQLMSQSGFFTEGEHSLRLDTDVTGAPWLAGYAATHGAGYAVILVNRDRDNAHTVPVQIAGRSLGVSVTQYTYGRAQYDHSSSGDWDTPPAMSVSGPWVGTYSATLPAFSVSVLVF